MLNKLEPVFEVEKDVPIPLKNRSRKYNFHKLKFEVGDSLLITEHKVLLALLGYVNEPKRKKISGHEYVSRKIGKNQWRVWRVS